MSGQIYYKLGIKVLGWLSTEGFSMRCVQDQSVLNIYIHFTKKTYNLGVNVNRGLEMKSHRTYIDRNPNWDTPNIVL